jgi:SAM-dependent methyltransferase
MTGDVSSYWNARAEGFDDEPDHGLRSADVRAAWADLLVPLMPQIPADVADLGCGTGSLSVLLGLAGYDVRGIDLAERMVALATQKAAQAGASACFVRADAADPPFAAETFDVVLVRHVLWAMPEPASAVRRWVHLLRPGGRLLLIEGRWHTGGGLSADETRGLVRRVRKQADVLPLDDPMLWGRPVDDQRYLVVSRE